MLAAVNTSGKLTTPSHSYMLKTSPESKRHRRHDDYIMESWQRKAATETAPKQMLSTAFVFLHFKTTWLVETLLTAELDIQTQQERGVFTDSNYQNCSLGATCRAASRTCIDWYLAGKQSVLQLHPWLYSQQGRACLLVRCSRQMCLSVMSSTMYSSTMYTV